jgi:hypothetical protein
VINRRGELMNKELDNIELKIRALGFSPQQAKSIIQESLMGRNWEEMNKAERKLALQSLDSRISFARKFFKFLNCNTCWK